MEIASSELEISQAIDEALEEDIENANEVDPPNLIVVDIF